MNRPQPVSLVIPTGAERSDSLTSVIPTGAGVVEEPAFSLTLLHLRSLACHRP